jgi:hypothetical protein
MWARRSIREQPLAAGWQRNSPPALFAPEASAGRLILVVVLVFVAIAAGIGRPIHAQERRRLEPLILARPRMPALFVPRLVVLAVLVLPLAAILPLAASVAALLLAAIALLAAVRAAITAETIPAMAIAMLLPA